MTQKPQRTCDLAHYSEARRCHDDDEKTFMSVTRRRAYRDALMRGCAVSVEDIASAHRLRPSPFDGAPITAAVLLRRFLTLQRCRVLPMLPRGVT
jgi:hypothetical protein